MKLNGRRKTAAMISAAGIIILLIVAGVCAFLPKVETADRIDFLMDTFIEQTVVGKRPQKTMEKVYQALLAFDKELSLYDEKSEINEINSHAGKDYVKVSKRTYDLLKRSAQLSQQSDDAFDFTIAPVTMLWHDAKKQGVPPTQQAIEEKLALVDWSKVLFRDEDSSVMLAEKGMGIDIGGIAKGYACDIVKEIYEQEKVVTGTISLGGNVYTYKAPQGQEGYRVGVRDPLGGENDPLMAITLTDCVLATSGAYERFFEYEGVSYHHIIDKKTGRPVDSDLLSATAICTDGALADFLSTTFYILGRDAALDAIRQQELKETPEFYLVLVDREQNIYISPSLMDKVEFFDEKSEEYTLVPVV